MRYINKQKHKATCGAIALANVFKKLGKNISYKDAIKLCGGLKSFNNSKGHIGYGMTTKRFMQIAKDNGLEVVLTRASLRDARWFSTFKTFAVVICYAWNKKGKLGGHFTVLDEHGKALNMGKAKDITNQQWKDTRKIWGHNPSVLIIKEKRGN